VPVSVSDETLDGAIDGANKVFYSKHRPIVDWDYDGDIKDDVTVKVDGTPATVESVEPDKGEITLTTAPTGETVTGSYYWSPLSDDEINEAIGSAQTEAENESSMAYEVADATYKETLTHGSDIFLPHYPINSISEVKVAGTVLDPEHYEYDEDGIVTLLDFEAGKFTAPYFLPTQFDVEVSYNHGWEAPPANVKRFVMVRAMEEALTTLNTHLRITEEIENKYVVEFSEESFDERIDKLRELAEYLKQTLPHRVSVI